MAKLYIETIKVLNPRNLSEIYLYYYLTADMCMKSSTPDDGLIETEDDFDLNIHTFAFHPWEGGE